MPDNKCVTETKTYGPPCFLDEHDKPSCAYKITECGMDLTGISRNEETERIFKAAERTGASYILSDKDIEEQVTAELKNTLSGRLPSADQKEIIKEDLARFKKDATELLEKLRKK